MTTTIVENTTLVSKGSDLSEWWPVGRYQASTQLPAVNFAYLKNVLTDKMSTEHVAQLRVTSPQLPADQDPATHEFET